MPDLNFAVTGVEHAVHGLTPLLHFRLGVTNDPPNETIQSVMLQAQIQIQAPGRSYSEVEKPKLIDLFGTPDQWGTTLRARLWTLTNTTIRTFAGTTEAILPVPCSFDLNVAGTKYFYALESGEVPLLFLFSGTVFYAAENGQLQVQQISWNKECTYRMPVGVWQKMMDAHYPNTAFISLQREVFERLENYKRTANVSSWEEAIEQLLLLTSESRNNVE